MKTFKIKDLNVSIDSPAANAAPDICGSPTVLCPGHSILCYQPTLINCGIISHCGGCSVLVSCFGFTNCGFVSNCAHFTPCACSHLPSLYDPTRDWITTTPVQQGIDTLQENELAQLKNSLGELQKAVDAKLQRSPEELNELEAKLTEALEEVRTQKVNARKK